MNPRSVLAALHRLNRNRRLVHGIAFGLHLTFRWLPPILWDRFDWAQDFSARATKACAWDADSVLRRAFGECGPGDFLPWRATDVLGLTARRRTPLGKVWQAEYEAKRWSDRLRYLRERYGIIDDAEATDDA
jgi:hypothetical protein